MYLSVAVFPTPYTLYPTFCLLVRSRILHRRQEKDNGQRYTDRQNYASEEVAQLRYARRQLKDRTNSRDRGNARSA